MGWAVRAADPGSSCRAMNFVATELRGAYVVEPERLEDDRGFFARTYCRKEFLAHGMNPDVVQCNISFNRSKGTLRGMHYQNAPYEEAKLVRCTRGAIFDVIVDLRRHSQTRGRWIGVELTSDNRRALYIPEGFAHGFQTLESDSEVFYQMSAEFHPEAARGVRWNDPALCIQWPLLNPTVSVRDAGYLDFIP